MIDLITGHQGVAHISADQIASINNAMMDNYGANKVMRLVGGELTANGLTIEVSTGYWRANGFDMEVQEAETIYIDPTAAGLSRIDNIYVEILQDIPTGAQRSEIVTVNGEPSATPTAPEAPTAPELNTDILLQVVPLASVTVTEGAMVMEDYSVAYNIVIPEDLAEVQTEVDTIVNVYGSKNLIPYPCNNGTRINNGITFTDNGDGTITANGTATAEAAYNMSQRFKISGNSFSLKNGNYLFSGCESGSNTTFYLQIAVTKNHTFSLLGKNFDGDTAITVDGDDNSNNSANIGIHIIIKSGQTVTNKVFKPMIRLASIQDDTYVPYVPTNKELMSCKLNGYVGAKNLIPYPYHHTTRVSNGITFTDNGDGTITASGTVTTGKTAFFGVIARAQSDFQLPVGTYVLSGCPKMEGVLIYVNHGNSSVTMDGTDRGDGAVIRGSGENTGCEIQIASGTVITTPITFKPMIRRVEDTDPTWQPYAKTNKELTDAFTNQVADSDDTYSPSKAYKVGEHCIYNNVIYKCITACSAGSWTTNQSCFSQTTLTSAVTDLNSALDQLKTPTHLGSNASSTTYNISDYNYIGIEVVDDINGTNRATGHALISKAQIIDMFTNRSITRYDIIGANSIAGMITAISNSSITVLTSNASARIHVYGA